MANINFNNPPNNIPDAIQWLIEAVQMLKRNVTAVSSSSSSGGSLIIGDPVSGGGANRVLFEDSSQNLASNAAFTYNASTGRLLVTKNTLIPSANAHSATFPDSDFTFAGLELANIFTALQTVLLNALGATTATGLSIQNSTAATSGHGAVLQSSPALTFLGSAQNGLSAVNGYRLYYNADSGRFSLGYTTNGSTYTELVHFESTGGITSTGTVTGNAISSTTGVVVGTTVTSYNGAATAGVGVESVLGSARATAQTAAIDTLVTYTLPASDQSFIVSANVLVTTSGSEDFNVECTYTDEGNTTRILLLPFNIISGSLSVLSNTIQVLAANGAVPYHGYPLKIRCKASTTITIKTTGTFTGCTYNVEGTISRVA